MFTELLLLDASGAADGHVASAFDHPDSHGSEPHILVGPEPASHLFRASSGAQHIRGSLRVCRPSAAPPRLRRDALGHETPGEARELMRNGDHGLVRAFRRGQLAVRRVQAAPGRPGVGGHLGRGALEAPASSRPMAGRWRYDQAASTRTRLMWRLPVLVIAPWRCEMPLECSPGTSPVKAMNEEAMAKRRKSQVSTAMVAAESACRYRESSADVRPPEPGARTLRRRRSRRRWPRVG